MSNRDHRFTDWGEPGAVTVTQGDSFLRKQLAGPSATGGTTAMSDRDHRFPLGRIVVTPDATEVLERSGENPDTFLQRHARGDWGELAPDGGATNEAALTNGTVILSGYATAGGEKVWVLTEWDRRRSTVMSSAECLRRVNSRSIPPSQLRAEYPTGLRGPNARHQEDTPMFALLFPDGAQLGITATDAARLLSPGDRVRRQHERDCIPLDEGCLLVCPLGDWRGLVGLD